MEYPEHYKILELPIDAGLPEIKRQYRKLAKKYHPDLNPGDKTAEDMFKKLKEAYETLSNENKRAEYDLGWKKQRSAEQKARKKQQQSTTASRPEPARKSPSPAYKAEPKSKKSPNTKQKIKPNSWQNKKKSFAAVRNIFLTSLFFSVALFFLTINVQQNKDDFANFFADIKNFSANPQGYFISRDVSENNLEATAETLKIEDNPKAVQNIANMKNADGYSLLMLAKTPEMSQMLLENGADVNYHAPDGYTALLLAVKNDHKAQVEALLKAGASVKVTDPKTGYNVLMLAKSDDIAYLLLKAGANPNFIAPDGTTPSSKAVKERNRKRLGLLRQFGAQINWSDVIAR